MVVIKSYTPELIPKDIHGYKWIIVECKTRWGSIYYLTGNTKQFFGQHKKDMIRWWYFGDIIHEEV